MRHYFKTESGSLRPLCTTRWMVIHKAFKSVYINYEPLLQMLDIISNGLNGSSYLDVRSKAGGILHNLQTFNLLFGVMLSEIFFGITDSLSWSLQGKNVSAFDANHTTETVCRAISGLRTDAKFETFWENARSKVQQLDWAKFELPHTRMLPRRQNFGSDPHANTVNARHGNL